MYVDELMPGKVYRLKDGSKYSVLNGVLWLHTKDDCTPSLHGIDHFMLNQVEFYDINERAVIHSTNEPVICKGQRVILQGDRLPPDTLFVEMSEQEYIKLIEAV